MRGKKGQYRSFIINMIIAFIVLFIIFGVISFLLGWWSGTIEYIKDFLRFGR